MILNQKTRLLYLGILIIFSVLGLIYFRNILLPLAYSVAFGIFVYPFYRGLEKRRVHKGICVFLVCCVFLVVSSLLLYLFAYAIQGWLDFFNGHGKELANVQDSFLNLLDQFKIKEYFIDEKGMERIVSMLQYFSFSLVNYLSLFVLSFVYYVFIFIAPDRYLERYLDYGKTGILLRTYIKFKFFFSLITALSVSLIFIAFKVENWQSISIFVFILNFIPNIGSIIATLLPLPMFYLGYGFSVEFWFLLLSTSFIQFLVGNMIEPKVMGNIINVPAIVVVIMLLFWGKIWGALGVFFAVPSLIVLSQIYPRIRRLVS